MKDGQRSIRELYDAVKFLRQPFPENEVSEIIARKDEAVPFLLEEFKSLCDSDFAQYEDEVFIGGAFCYFLLAQFRVQEAFPYFMRLLHFPEEILEKVLSDDLTESGARLIVSLYDGDIRRVRKLVEAKKADSFARSQGLIALALLALHGKHTAREIADIYRHYLDPVRGLRDQEILTSLAANCAIIHPDLLMPELEAAYDTGLIDVEDFPFEFVEKYRVRTQEELFAAALRDPYNLPVEDSIREMSWWECFKTKQQIRKEKRRERRMMARVFEYKTAGDHLVDQVVRAAAKVGRNDPCPCGSGMKYKRCCGK